MTRARARRVSLTVAKKIAIVKKKISNVQKASRKIFQNAQIEKNVETNNKNEAFIKQIKKRRRWKSDNKSFY